MPIKKIKARLVPKKRWKVLLGLTGGIGTGKTTVLRMFRKKGAFTLDADAIVKKLLKNDRGIRNMILKTFGTLDKKKLAKVVFLNPSRRKVLEKIIHPRVRKKIQKQLLIKRGHLAVCDIPLLYEKKWEKGFDAVVVVRTNRSKQINRLKNKGLKLKDIQARIKSQMPLQKKVSKADFIVNNNGSLKKTNNQIRFIWNQLTN